MQRTGGQGGEPVQEIKSKDDLRGNKHSRKQLDSLEQSLKQDHREKNGGGGTGHSSRKEDGGGRRARDLLKMENGGKEANG